MLSPLHLRTLSVVLRLGSFAAAGRQLRYTGSAVSQQISALEADTGLTLFERAGHAIRPTKAAHMLSERSSETLGTFFSLEEAVRQMAAGTRGRLGLGSFPTASQALIPSTLGRFSRAFPDIDVRFYDGELEQLVPQLMEGDLEIVVAYHYDLVPRGWPTIIERTPLMSEDLRLLVPPNVQRRAENIKLTDFAHLPWISTREGSDGALAVERACAAEGFIPQIRYRTNDYDVIASFVQAGLGVAAIPLLAYSRQSELNAVAATDLTVRRHVEILTRKGPQNPALKEMVFALRTAADTFASRAVAEQRSPH